MFKATLKGLLSRKLRLVLSALSVVLGVMFVSGAFVLTDTLGKSFDAMFQDIDKSVDVQITAKPKVKSTNGDAPQVSIPAADVATVRGVTGVAKAEAGVFTTGARVVGKDGKVLSSFGPPQFGSSWSGENDLVQLRSGRGPTTDNEIAMDAATAKTTK
jgi:putative ABC transport system permease protein